ncbi:MAG: DUF1428 domain-containing protein [Candidatus Gracilibacteria bacterium]|nr:DUF1428 domain-containing protein [Candidatus Peregrinibacteria bacterium]
MEPYVDGFVIAIKKDKVDAYKKMAELGKKVWMKHGALAYFECVGDDMHPDWNMDSIPEEMRESMKGNDFPNLCKTGDDQTTIFSFIIFKSREHRDEVNAKVMTDPEMGSMQDDNLEMPFGMKDMTYGGFKAIVYSELS